MQGKRSYPPDLIISPRQLGTVDIKFWEAPGGIYRKQAGSHVFLGSQSQGVSLMT